MARHSGPEENPNSSAKALGPIPRGIEVLVKKAAVDPSFKQTLLSERAKAADEIGLKLEPAEAAMLTAVPDAQLETIIANTDVSEVSRAAFLGRAAAVMLAALGVSAQGCSRTESTDGIRPDRIPIKGAEKDRPPKKDAEADLPPAAAQSPGSRPDLPPEPKPRSELEGAASEPPPVADPPEPKPLERPTEVRPKGGVRPE